MKHRLCIANGGDMKTYLFFLALIVLPAHAQVTFFNDSMGLPLGTARTVGNTTFYNDSLGLPLGTARSVGNTTFYNDALGLPLGTSYMTPPIPSYTPKYTSPPAPTFPPSPLFPTGPQGW